MISNRCWAAISCNSSIRATRPFSCTGMIARVRGVINARTDAGSTK